MAAPKRILIGLTLAVLDRILHFIGPRYRTFYWVVANAPPRMLARIGKWRAVRAARHARAHVPAYADHLQRHEVSQRDLWALRLPATDKDNYVRAYPIEQRCLDGRLAFAETTIDESSGSSGVPHNWVRSARERAASHIFISHFARYCFGREPWITINAFSMGAWATGVNMGIALQRNSLVKSTGPDVDKILGTLEFFGDEYPYLICGYPPFLKHLVDVAADRGFPLGRYRLNGLVGGEGMPEGLRDYLLPTFDAVYSGYGATDLEIGLAGETPFTVAVRRLARDDEHVREALFGDDSRLPMVFQYNPLAHHITTNEDGELSFTIERLDVLSPRIEYNIHDEGGLATFADLVERLRSVGVDRESLVGPDDPKPLRLPLVWVYGRKDSTVSVMGANLYPEDVEQALYAEPALAGVTHSYCLSLEEGDTPSPRPVFSFELRVPASPELQARFETRIIDGVRSLSADFRVALDEHPDVASPIIRLFALGEGPFARDESRIKQTRVISLGEGAEASG